MIFIQILNEYTPYLPDDQGAAFSCFYHYDSRMYAVNTSSLSLYVMSQNDDVQRYSIGYAYQKIVYDEECRTYIAVYPKYQDKIFLLDANCQEKDFLKIRTFRNKISFTNLWYAKALQCIFYITTDRISRYNKNGDYLGDFMCSPYGVSYTGMCTGRNYVFVSLIEENSVYIASYTLQGVFLEKICIGNEVYICNMQVREKEYGSFLRVYGMKKHCFPCILEIELQNSCKPEKYLSAATVTLNSNSSLIQAKVEIEE